MGGKKVKLAFILKDASRKAAYRKRRKGLMKKLDEITTLCGVEACAIMYRPDDRDPEIWPSPQGVQQALLRFLQVPEFERNRKMMNQESYLKERILKAKEKLKKAQKENKKQETTLQLYKCFETGNLPENMSLVDQDDLTNLIDQKMKEIEMKMAEMGIAQNNQRQQETVLFEPNVIGGDGVANNNNMGMFL